MGRAGGRSGHIYLRVAILIQGHSVPYFLTSRPPSCRFRKLFDVLLQHCHGCKNASLKSPTLSKTSVRDGRVGRHVVRELCFKNNVHMSRAALCLFHLFPHLHLALPFLFRCCFLRWVHQPLLRQRGYCLAESLNNQSPLTEGKALTKAR